MGGFSIFPKTRAEASDYRETSRHADVLSFIDDLARSSDLVHRTSMGRSGEGQDLAVLIISDGRCFTPEEARRQRKAIVMIEANIHAGEVEGKEALLALCRDLATTRLGQKILSRLCLVCVPNLNPDGNDRISPDNRRLDLARLEGQVNPEGGVGTRYTGKGWNLNRDAMKQEAEETRCLAGLFHEWWPHVFIDCHTTDGSIHGFDLTYDTFHNNQQLFGKLLSYTRSFLDKASRRLEREQGIRSFWYGNYVVEDDPESGWRTYPPLPRFGSHYRGLCGRMDILLETYSYLGYRRRCEVIYAWLLELVRAVAKNRHALMRVVEKEEARIVRRGAEPDPRERVAIDYGVARRDEEGRLRFDYPAYALDGESARIVAFDRESLAARRYPGDEVRKYRAPHLRTFLPTATVTTPHGYLVPAHLAERLRGHGIVYETLAEERTLEVESYLILHRDTTYSPDVAGSVPPAGAPEVPLSAAPPPSRFETVLSVRPERRRETFPQGTLFVPTAQRAGTLLVYLLEPHSDDGFCRWQLLDEYLAVGGLFPIHRVLSPWGIERREPARTDALDPPKAEA